MVVVVVDGKLKEVKLDLVDGWDKIDGVCSLGSFGGWSLCSKFVGEAILVGLNDTF